MSDQNKEDPKSLLAIMTRQKTNEPTTTTAKGADFRKAIRKAKMVFVYILCVDDYCRITKKQAIECIEENEVEISVYQDGRIYIDSVSEFDRR